MPRLFTGIEIPDQIAASLSRFRSGLRDARWIEPTDYHVTLRFLGDVDAEVAETMHDLLDLARPRPPLFVTLDGIGQFGGEKPRAIIASVGVSTELTELHTEHERIARDSGAPPERRKFTPHVTLARLRRAVSAADVALYLARAGLFEPISFTATRVALFSARTSTGGGPYVIEATYPLS